MASSLIKGLAITLGGGLAVGLGIKIGQSAVAPTLPQESLDFGPVLDRIEGVESRIINVESAQAALAALTESGPMLIPGVQELEQRVQAHSKEVDALRAAIQQTADKSDARINDVGSAVSNLQARIPLLIDESIKPKFEELHDRVQREMQETASQTLEIFADRIQARVVEKITSIEGDLTRQSDAINDLRDYSLKTDQNLQRLLAGVENLADKINRKFEVPGEPSRFTPPYRPSAPSAQVSATGGVSTAPAAPPQGGSESRPGSSTSSEPALPAPPSKPTDLAGPATETAETKTKFDFAARIGLAEETSPRPARENISQYVPKSLSAPEGPQSGGHSSRGSGLRRAAFAGGGLALTAMAFGAIELTGILPQLTSTHAASDKMAARTTSRPADTLDPTKLADQSRGLDQARAFVQDHDYGKAEQVYRSILKTDPSNAEVKRLLASALYRQDKIEDSVKILKSLEDDQAAPQGPDKTR